MPREVVVPDPITLRNPEDDTPLINPDQTPREPMSFKTFVLTTLLSDPSWTSTMSHIGAASDIIRAVRSNSQVIVLQDSVWEKLRSIAESPGNCVHMLHPAVLTQLLPFFRAISEAAKAD